MLLMRSPVRGGLKGGRRSVKRGQSVEFADYRDYTLGDDLRQLDWNVYARLEKLFVKLFIEEEDVTVTSSLDASASMASGPPDKLLFAKRAAAALGYIGLASEDRVAVTRWPGRTARRRAGAARHRARVPGAGRPVGDRSRGRPDRPRRRRPPRRRAAPRPGRRRAADRDLLDPNAERVIRELAGDGLRARSSCTSSRRTSSTRRSRATCGWSTPRPATGRRHGRPARRSTPTRRASRRGRPTFADLAAKRRGRATCDLARRAPGRPGVRRAAPPSGAGLGRPMPLLAPLALLGLLFVPVVIAMYLLKLRRDEAVVPSTLLWQRLVADVEANAPWQKLRRSLLLLLQLLLVAASSPSSRRGRSSSDPPAWPATSCSSSTPRRAWPRPTSSRTG